MCTDLHSLGTDQKRSLLFQLFLLLLLQTERLVACRLNILPGQAMLTKVDANITCSDCTFMYPSGQEPMESIWKGEAYSKKKTQQNLED